MCVGAPSCRSHPHISLMEKSGEERKALQLHNFSFQRETSAKQARKIRRKRCQNISANELKEMQIIIAEKHFFSEIHFNMKREQRNIYTTCIRYQQIRQRRWLWIAKYVARRVSVCVDVSCSALQLLADSFQHQHQRRAVDVSRLMLRRAYSVAQHSRLTCPSSAQSSSSPLYNASDFYRSLVGKRKKETGVAQHTRKTRSRRKKAERGLLMF